MHNTPIDSQPQPVLRDRGKHTPHGCSGRRLHGNVLDPLCPGGRWLSPSAPTFHRHCVTSYRRPDQHGPSMLVAPYWLAEFPRAPRPRVYSVCSLCCSPRAGALFRSQRMHGQCFLALLRRLLCRQGEIPCLPIACEEPGHQKDRRARRPRNTGSASPSGKAGNMSPRLSHPEWQSLDNRLYRE